MVNHGDDENARLPDATVDGTENADIAEQAARELLAKHNDDLTLSIAESPFSRRTWVEVAERFKNEGYAVKLFDDDIVIRRL